MTQTDIDLAALIGSRICHDLISPIGAINNGLELLNLSGMVASGPEMDLIGDSVSNASAKIRFFRVAYGAANTQLLAPSEVVSILHGLRDSGRVDVAWHPAEPQSRAEVRLIFLALQCLETAMAFGGRIDIAKTDGTWMLNAKADKLLIKEDLWHALSTGHDLPDLMPAHVQFKLAPMAAADLGRRFKLQTDETSIQIEL